jgi:hypothetical protein
MGFNSDFKGLNKAIQGIRMSSTGGTTCGPVYANCAGVCCTAVVNDGLMALSF